MNVTRRQSFLAHAFLLAIVLVWGATFSVVQNALRDCTPLLFNTLRMTLACIALAAVHLRHLRNLSRSAVRAGAVAGLFLALGYALQTTGLQTTTAPRCAFLTGLVVVLVPLFCIVPKLRPPGTPRPGIGPLFGAVGAFAGIVLLTTPAGLPLSEFTHGLHLGDLLSFLCAIAFAAHLLSLSHLARQIPASQLATLQIGFAALFLALAMPLVETPRLHISGYLIFAMLLCALVGTAAAFYVQTWAQQYLQASHTALLLALEPAFALLTALFFFGERLTLRSGLGAALILVSLIASELLSSQPVSEQPEANAA